MYNPYPEKKIQFGVFTKPWKEISLEELGEKVASLGFDSVEYPFRKDYQVQPSDGYDGLIRLGKTLSQFGISVASLASGIDVRCEPGTNQVVGVDEWKLAGCQEIGCKIIRICQGFDSKLGFHENIEQIRRKYDAIVPYCEKYGVTLGVQMHCGGGISNSAETYILLQGYDPKQISAVWDSGHSGLAGNVPSLAIDTIWDSLSMVNFKAAYRERINGPEAEEAKWNEYWTTARHACGSWKAAVEHLKARGYEGVYMMPAEYSDNDNVEAYTKEDLAYLKSLVLD